LKRKDKYLRVRVSDDLLKSLKKEARLQKTEMSEMVRKALDHYVATQQMKREYDARR
jgi:predicted transcriptional regulator